MSGFNGQAGQVICWPKLLFLEGQGTGLQCMRGGLRPQPRTSLHLNPSASAQERAERSAPRLSDREATDVLVNSLSGLQMPNAQVGMVSVHGMIGMSYPLSCQELRLLREVLQDGAFLSQVEESLGLEGGQMTEPAQAAQQSPQPAKLPAQQATDTGIPTRSLEKIRFQDLIHTESGDGAATTSRGFRQAEAVKSLDHLSARVVERRRQGELPLGQVPSIG